MNCEGIVVLLPFLPNPTDATHRCSSVMARLPRYVTSDAFVGGGGGGGKSSSDDDDDDDDDDVDGDGDLPEAMPFLGESLSLSSSSSLLL